MHFAKTFAVAALVLAYGAQASIAASTGNLKGKITDITTGEALPLVNVLLVGSGRGGVTNDQGEYFIKDITPGTYPLRVSLLGYQTIEQKKVEIEAGETAVLNFKLASTDIEMEG